MDAKTIWREYERGVNFLDTYDYVDKANECYRFYNGDQWEGLKTDGQRFAQYNIIAPIVDYKTSVVNANGNTRYYTCDESGEKYERGAEVCNKINSYAMQTWERLKMDSKLWRLTKNAAITGESYLYFFYENGYIHDREIHGINIFFADEQQVDIQKQKYIIIAQRLMASDVKAEAKQNGVSKDDIELIVPDNETQNQIGSEAKTEIAQEDDDGKLICLIKFYKKDGQVHFVKSTKNVIYRKDTVIDGLRYYPIARQMWDVKEGGARGAGAVYSLIANQIEINLNVARVSLGLKNLTFPNLVYDITKMKENGIADIGKVGTSIGVNGVAGNVGDLITYITPPGIHPQVTQFIEQMMTTTRELSGASDAVTGQINPERASGAAILAVRDAAALPLTEKVSNQKQFIEDVARIWLDMWIAYNPEGLTVRYEEDGEYLEEIIDTELLREMEFSVKIDVSPANPFSKFAQEQTLLNFMTNGIITFEEYVAALEDDASAPKSKLIKILEERQRMQAMQGEQETDMTAQALQKLLAENAQLKEAIK
jgi:hypothetical protein